ncbi:MAG: ATP-binding protein [Planctomycetaceae bacterium]|nr:ATP-binding protein [Planctomycetaceae bacterium]
MHTIRFKFLFCLALLLILVWVLALVGYSALSFYRNAVRDIGERLEILPISLDISAEIEELRSAFDKIDFFHQQRTLKPLLLALDQGTNLQKTHFENLLSGFSLSLERYAQLLQGQLEQNKNDETLNREAATLHEIRLILEDIKTKTGQEDWASQRTYIDAVGEELRKLRILVGNIPKYQLEGLNEYSENVKNRYQTLYSLTIFTGITSAILLSVLVRLGYVWVFRPLSVLIDGSRIIASGRFQHRIKLNTQDEMSELAKAMNEMTERFQTICADLDRQIQIRSQEAVRNERLASVGFLAAGVAHEINNPLASIVMCSESLEKRLEPLLLERKAGEHGEDIVRKYLKMIQTEAFRCKTITEKLLDFARTEKSNREKTDLSSLIYGMVEMLAHHGDYRDKEVQLSLPESLRATVNPQEMKQVMLNLLTNALDSISQGGVVRVKLYEKSGVAHLIVEDNGCGMDAEVLQNVFEPFYTRKKQGQGTGLGLSITHRIISDHDGRIEASSPGPGKGSTFRIEIPVNV